MEDIKRVVVERVRVVDRIAYILETLQTRETIGFEELFSGIRTRTDLVVTFLALLELIRLQVIKAFQPGNFGPIQLKRAVSLDDDKMKTEYLTSLVDREAKFGKGENPVGT